MAEVCDVCSENALPTKRLMRCSRCKKARYCSRGCQQVDWNSHKSVCSRRKEEEEEPIILNTRQNGNENGKRCGWAPQPNIVPSSLRQFKYHCSPDGVEGNLLVLFHGLGDDMQKFFNFGTSLNLPQTSVLALRAPKQLPFGLDGYSWFDSFESDGNLIPGVNEERRRRMSMTATTSQVNNFLKSLINSCGWASNRIFLFGFSQGARVAIDVARHNTLEGRLGGVIAVSSCLLEEEGLSVTPNMFTQKLKDTPIMITHGTQDDRIPMDVAKRHAHMLKSFMGGNMVEMKEYKKGHAMVQSKKEAGDLHKFFASHLYLRDLAMEKHPDIVELQT